MKKSWTEKLADDKDLPSVFEIGREQSKRFGTGTMVIPAPRQVDSLMKRVPKGRVVTINELRATLAAIHKADHGCPITTGIFSWIAAHAAAEAEAKGAKRITPYWRTLKNGGEVNPKYPGGLDEICRRLKAEGHRIQRKGKRAFVVDFEKALVTRDRLVAQPSRLRVGGPSRSASPKLTARRRQNPQAPTPALRA
jgi:hypothetical protein